MPTFKACISGIGALVILFFLVRNTLKMPKAVKTAKYPKYTIVGYLLSLGMSISMSVPWAIAVFFADDQVLWFDLMLGPIVPVLIIMFLGNGYMNRQSPEVQAYARDIASKSKFINVISRLSEDQHQ